MKKRFLIIILILFLMSGCTINYDLTIDNDSILEDVNITISAGEVDDYDSFISQVEHPRPVYFGNGITYKYKEKEDDDNYYVNYKYKHDISLFSKSSFLNTCYTKSNIDVTENKISISTSNVFKCISMEDGYRADKADINIKTKLKVLDNNADEVNGNVYTWHMDRREYSDKPINITMQKNKTATETIESVVDNISNIEIIIVLMFLGIFSIIIYFYIKRKREKRNQF